MDKVALRNLCRRLVAISIQLNNTMIELSEIIDLPRLPVSHADQVHAAIRDCLSVYMDDDFGQADALYENIVEALEDMNAK